MEMEEKTVWVTGCKGHVGSEVASRLVDYGYHVVGTDTEVPITDSERLYAFVQAMHPQVIINAAGIPRYATELNTRVKAYETNAMGAGNIAVAANSVGAKLIQISTDDVFPIRVHEPMNEFDSPAPFNAYGKSKRAGEAMVRDTMENFLIVRSSWIYGTHLGILQDVLNAVKTGEKYQGRTDQISSPTSIATYVRFIHEAIQHDGKGVLHIASRGSVSRYDFAVKALQLCGYNPADYVEPAADLVTSEQIVLESMVIEMLGHELPTWDQDLEAYLKEVGLAK